MKPAIPVSPFRCGESLQRALSRGAASLDAGAKTSVATFVRSQQNADGGFRGRSVASDLYYTVFGLECARALALELPAKAIRNFVEAQARESLDFVHLSCLARCLEILWPAEARPTWSAQLNDRLAEFACMEGGYHRKPGQRHGSVYETFLGTLARGVLEWNVSALSAPRKAEVSDSARERPGVRQPSGAFGDPRDSKREGAAAVQNLADSLNHRADPCTDPSQLGTRLLNLCQSSGGFINGDGLAAASTPVTSAALLLLHEAQQPLPPKSIEWLLKRQCSRGGFAAAALVPIADLLSTATALHALNCIGQIHAVSVDACLDFVTGCWDDSGGFHAHALDRSPDCEYTFYGLLALGNLVAEPAASEAA